MSRREYKLPLNINNRPISKVVIDAHYEEKHGDSITDKIILALVKQLDGGRYEPENLDEDDFEYYVEDYMEYEGKFYKLIWLLHEREIYIGVVNCYRRK